MTTMKNKYLYPLLIVLALPVAGYTQHLHFSIDGTINTPSDSAAQRFVYLSGKGVPHDSIKPVNNTYHFEGELTEPGPQAFVEWSMPLEPGTVPSAGWTPPDPKNRSTQNVSPYAHFWKH